MRTLLCAGTLLLTFTAAAALQSTAPLRPAGRANFLSRILPPHMSAAMPEEGRQPSDTPAFLRVRGGTRPSAVAAVGIFGLLAALGGALQGNAAARAFAARELLPPRLFVHIAAVSYLIGCTCSSVTLLRAFSIISSVMSIAFAAWIRMWPNVLWNVIFMIPNGVRLVQLLTSERGSLTLSAREHELYERGFMRYGVVPRDFSTILKRTRPAWREVRPGELIVSQGAPMPTIWFLVSGSVEVVREGEIGYTIEPDQDPSGTSGCARAPVSSLDPSHPAQRPWPSVSEVPPSSGRVCTHTSAAPSRHHPIHVSVPRRASPVCVRAALAQGSVSCTTRTRMPPTGSGRTPGVTASAPRRPP